MLAPRNDTGACLQGCYNGDCGAGTNNYLSLATVCDERLSQLWLMSTENKELVNVASGSCVSITSNDVVTLATCGSASPAQTWTWYANGTLVPESVPGQSLAVCASGAVGCNSKIMELIANDGEMMTIAADTDDTAASAGWEEVAPSEHPPFSNQVLAMHELLSNVRPATQQTNAHCLCKRQEPNICH